MCIFRAAVCGLGFIVLAPAWADAQSMTFNLVAHVPEYCRISAQDNVPVAFHGRVAEIGAISEICNTANGYDVRTSFTNVTGGVLRVAGNIYQIDAFGSALRSNPVPAMRTLEWRVADAVIMRPDEPVTMRVTITPR